MSDTEKPKEVVPETAGESIESKPETALSETVVPEPTKEEPAAKESAPAESAAAESPGTVSEPAAPPRPPRPLSPKAAAKKTLKEAFPDVEDKYITMVLIASRGQMEPAFSALLYLSDPSVEQELVIVPEQKPKLPSRNKQLESDEALARRLAREYERQSGGRGSTRRSGDARSGAGISGSRRRHQEGDGEGQDDDILDRFIEKDLPQMKEQFNKNVEEARVKLGGWIGGFKQRMNSQADGSNELFSAFGSGNEENIKYNRDRRDHSEEATEAVQGITLKDNDLPEKSLPNPPEDIYGTPTSTTKEPTEKAKWQPLKSVQPEPVSNDTFLVTDSEEEDESK